MVTTKLYGGYVANVNTNGVLLLIIELKALVALVVVVESLKKEWNYNKNGALKLESFLPKSGKKVWWLCSHCGYEWEKEIRARTNGSPCPNCKYKLNTK